MALIYSQFSPLHRNAYHAPRSILLYGYALSRVRDKTLAVVLLVALAEFVGGILILAGAFTRDWVTRLGAGFFIPVLAGAIAFSTTQQT